MICDLYFSPNIISVMNPGWDGQGMRRAGTTKTRNSYRGLVGEAEGKGLTAQMC